MSTITYSRSHPGLFAEAERGLREVLTDLRGALAARQAYRRTLAELDALNMRQREDIGIAGLETRDIARAASRLA